MKKIFYLNLLAIVSIALCTSCGPEPDPDPNPTPNPNTNPTTMEAKGLYVLNEGSWGGNNSSISYYDFATGEVTEDIFLQVNQRGLGDTGNDMQSYGSKLYCVVNMSERLEIMNLATCESMETVSLAGKQPREMAFYDGNVYISCFDGSVVVVDTANYQIIHTLQAGDTPEGICVANNKLYVANSGGNNYPTYNNTMSIFDLANHALLSEVTVALNPTKLQADAQGNVYLISMGNYNDVAPSFQKIDSQMDTVVKVFDWPVSNFTIQGNYAYLYHYDYGTSSAAYKKLDTSSDVVVDEDFSEIEAQMPYGIMVNSKNNDLFITDAIDNIVNGDVYGYDLQGNLKFKIEAGISPSGMVLKY